MSTSDLLNPESPAYKKARRQFYKATKNRPPVSEKDWTPFRAAEKRYKARFPPPDLSNVLDLAQLDPSREHEITQGVWKGSLDPVEYRRVGSAYTIPDIPGLVILPSFVSHKDQRNLIRWALERQARHPNPTNLDVHYHLPKEGLWNRYLQEPETTIRPKAVDSDGKGDIDEELHDICRKAVHSVDWKEVYEGTQLEWEQPEDPEWKYWRDTYEPDAGIVNFYQTKDTLMAHVDRSEVCATSPLVSISLGNASVFLIGGNTRESEPIPLLLRSGDVVIMSGPVARRAYHGVPRILEETLPPHLQGDSDDWRPFARYMKTTRINVNVRQVFPMGFNAEEILQKVDTHCSQ